MLNMSCRKRIRERNWLLLSLLNYAFSFIVIAVHRFHQVCENAHLLLSSMPLFLSSVSWCQLSILDVFLFELFRNGSAPLPLFSPLYVFVCVWPNAIANMEVSMSFVYLKESRRRDEDCFVCKTLFVSICSIENIDLEVEVINDNCITRTMTLYLLLTLFHLLTFSAKNIQARQSSNCLIISNMKKMRVGRRRERESNRKRERNFFVIISVRCFVLEQDSRGNTWYFILRNAQVFKIIR